MLKLPFYYSIHTSKQKLNHFVSTYCIAYIPACRKTSLEQAKTKEGWKTEIS
jgi:hypothetical protein